MKKLLLCAAALLVTGCTPRLQPSFNPAVQPKAEDLGPHGDLMEWWYLSGYLPDQNLAFHWAQFKVLPPKLPLNIMFAHVAVTDLSTGEVNFYEQGMNPGSASFPPLKLSDGDWTLVQGDKDFKLNAGPLVLSAAPLKLPVIHPPGYSGIPEKTGALYYQSMTRLALSGTISGRPVQGLAWLDHQWGGMAPGRGALWDWMGVHLGGGDDLMLYRVRLPSGEIVQTIGSIIDKSGKARAATHLYMEPGRVWKSKTGREYILSWKVKADEFELNINALHDSQELLSKSTAVAYWEGPVQVDGTWLGQTSTGNGMMELVAGTASK